MSKPVKISIIVGLVLLAIVAVYFILSSGAVSASTPGAPAPGTPQNGQGDPPGDFDTWEHFYSTCSNPVLRSAIPACSSYTP